MATVDLNLWIKNIAIFLTILAEKKDSQIDLTFWYNNLWEKIDNFM